jgi:hypothetical protein
LWGSDAQIATAAGAQKASLENGYLHVDFVRGNFSTGFGLTQGANTWSRQAQGPLVGDGTFGNASQYLGGNNMVVSGALAQSPNGGGLQAGYVFQSRIDNTRLASGVAYWGR